MIFGRMNKHTKNIGYWRSPRDLVCTALAVILGLVVGYLDLHVTEVVVTVVALLISGLLLGLIQTKGTWRWALLIAIGLPIMEFVAIRTGMHTAEPARLDPLIALVALVLAFLGTYLGVFMRYLIRS
jgi:hypothetical protein